MTKVGKMNMSKKTELILLKKRFKVGRVREKGRKRAGKGRLRKSWVNKKLSNQISGM